MPTSFRPYAPDQDLLLAPRLHEWLPDEHLAYFIGELVGQLDLGDFYAPYEDDGRRKQPYEPGMMLKVLIYAYATGVFASRKLATKLEEDVAFRVLAAGNFPQHRTICAFRKRHLADFKALFIDVVQLAGALGLARLGTVAIDGTKLRANASKHKGMSYDRLEQQAQRLSEEIESMCASAAHIDRDEDARYGVDQRGDALPEEIRHRQGRLASYTTPKLAWKAPSATSTRPAGAMPTISVDHRAAKANPINAITACPRRGRKATSPIQTGASCPRPKATSRATTANWPWMATSR